MFHFMANSYWQPLDFELPPVTGEAEYGWRRIIDTFREAPEDLQHWSDAPLHSGGHYTVQARSVVLLARLADTGDSAATPQKVCCEE